VVQFECAYAEITTYSLFMKNQPPNYAIPENPNKTVLTQRLAAFQDE